MTAALGVLALSLATLGWLLWQEWSDRHRRWVDVDARIREAERLTGDGRWVGLPPVEDRDDWPGAA